MYFITYVDRVNIGTAGPFIKDELGLSNTQLGFVFSAFAYPYTLFQIFGGWVGDRYGPRRTLLICCLIWATGTILTGLAGGVMTLFLARVLLGIGEGATFPTATRAMQNWIPVARRGFAQGLAHAFSRLGNAVAPPFVVLLVASVTWRGSFVALGLIDLTWVLIWFLYFRDDPRKHKHISKEEIENLPAYSGISSKDKRKLPTGKLVMRMLPVTLTYFCYAFTLWVYLGWLPSFFLRGYNIDIKGSAIFSSGVFFAGVVGDTLGGILSDHLLKKTNNVKFARLAVVVPGLLGGAACLTGAFFTKDLTTIALLLSGGFFCLEMTIGPMWAVPMDIAPQFAGTAAGLMNIGSAVGAIVSPLIFGFVVDLTGNWMQPFAGSIGLLLLGTLLAFRMHPERRFTETATDTPSSDLSLQGERANGRG
jgi:MFS family permease